MGSCYFNWGILMVVQMQVAFVERREEEDLVVDGGGGVDRIWVA